MTAAARFCRSQVRDHVAGARSVNHELLQALRRGDAVDAALCRSQRLRLLMLARQARTIAAMVT